MRMSTGAVDLMNWLTEQYAATSNGNYRTWTFTPQEGDPRIVELLDLGLIAPLGSRRGPHRLTERGHQWVLDNRKPKGDPVYDEFEDMAYPETFVIGGAEFKGQRPAGKNKVLIPCDGEPPFQHGDVISQRSGRGMIELRIIDAGFVKGGTVETSRFPDMLTLIVENITAAQHKASSRDRGISVGSITAGAVLVGDGSVQTVTITLQDLVQQVAKSGDAEAKGLMAKFFGNPTISSIVGSGAAELLKKIIGG